MILDRLICSSTRNDVSYHDSTVNLSHFHMLRVMGKGSYGRVRCVERKKIAGLYALKYVDKIKCAKYGVAANVVQERKLLEEVNHPFLVNMYFAFQDDINCYFVLDLMLGGDLRFHRSRRGSLGENTVRFYVAEISSALSYLHKIGICHRDVKPENILLDLQGHAHLTDFNVAIHYSEERFHSAIAGTMVYMAPEMLSRTGYSWQVDYWSLGVTAYECLFFGRRPFANGSKDADVVMKSILQDPLVFPPDDGEFPGVCSAEGRAALAALLERDPGRRLGCRTWSRKRGQSHLRDHPWFRDIDWERLESRQLAPPFLPDSGAWNFEDFDETFVSDRALLHRINRLSHMSEKISSEQRYLAENFTSYDWEKTSRKSYYSHNELIASPGRASTRESMLQARTSVVPAVTPTPQI